MLPVRREDAKFGGRIDASPGASSVGVARENPRLAVSGARRARLAIVPLAVLCLLWAWLLIQLGGLSQGPRAVSFGGDFALNMSSATLLKAGGNPYDGAALLRAERSYMNASHIHVKLGRAQAPLTWGGYPPLFFWLLEPLTAFPFGPVAVAWIGFLAVTLLAGFIALLRYTGWTSIAPATLLFALMPQTTLEEYYANPTAFVAGDIFFVLFLQRRFPLAAGLLFSLAFLKPQLAVPTGIVITAFVVGDRRRFLSGLSAGLLVLLGASLVTVGPRVLLHWVTGMYSVSSMVAQQPNMAPWIGLYAAWAAPPVRMGIELLLGAGTIVATAVAWRRLRQQTPVNFAQIGWLWALWFLILPYAHFADEVLLAPAILALLGINGARLRNPWAALTLYLLFFSVLLFSFRVHGALLLSLPLTAILVILYRYNGGLKAPPAGAAAPLSARGT